MFVKIKGWLEKGMSKLPDIAISSYDFGVTLSRLRPGKAFKAAERISSCLEHTLLFASANKNPPTDGLELADIGTLPTPGAWLA